MQIEQKLSTAKNLDTLKKQIAKFYFTQVENIKLLDCGFISVKDEKMQYTRWTEYKTGFMFYVPHNPLY